VPPGLEGRLYFVWACAILYPASYISYGWLVHTGKPLWAALVFEFLFGTALILGFSGLSNYLIDIYPTRGASITSINNLSRSLWAAIAVQIAPSIQRHLGYGRTFTLFGGLALIGIPILFVLTTSGERLRRR
ncbi:hypothetical protein GQ42DRAFT_108764, partial [Ramicandelaber brevisporus]